MKYILLIPIMLLSGCAGFWESPLWGLVDDPEPETKTVIVDGKEYELKEVE